MAVCVPEKFHESVSARSCVIKFWVAA